MSNFQKVFIFALSICLSASANKIENLQHIGLENIFGGNNTLHLKFDSRCVFRLDKVFTQFTDAVINYNDCVRLFESTHCNGNFLQLPATYYRYSNLDFWRLPEHVSVSACPHSCFEQRQNSSDIIVNVTIFSQKDYKGSELELIFNKCKSIPEKFNNLTTSIQTNGNCVQLYNNDDCRMDQHDSKKLELLPGQPLHNDLTLWNMPTVKSVSPCIPNSSSGTLRFQPPLQGEVYLFELENFGGLSLRINVSSEECISLNYYWKEKPQSLIIGSSTCLTLFEEDNCRGREIDVNFSITSLNMANINWTTTSVQSCAWIMEANNVDLNEGTYTNSVDVQKDNLEINTTKHENTDYFMSSHFIYVNVIVLLFGVSVFVIVTLVVLKKCHPFGQLIEKLTDKEIDEFLAGIETGNLSPSIDAVNDNFNEIIAQLMPYDKKFEICRSKISFDESVTLGIGEFGVVHKGILIQDSAQEAYSKPEYVVAIKTAKPSSGSHGLRSLLKEVKVMQYLGSHVNIAKLIGCCTEKLKQGEIFLVLEYYSEGSLESYLRRNAMLFENLVENGEIRLNKQFKSQPGERLPFEKETYVNTKATFDTLMLVKWTVEVARGMEFLSERKVLHSDLAARNVLLTDMLQTKISDFGLSRKMYKYSQYKKESKELLPWKWLAIECLKFSEYTIKSDVWSYGVLCWEIFSLGQTPYLGQTWTDSFLLNLENGMRLEKPENSSNDFYDLMQCCWNSKSDERPTFAQITNGIEEMFFVSNAIE